MFLSIFFYAGWFRRGDESLDGLKRESKSKMPADNELTAKLSRRLDRNEALEQGQQVTNTYRTTGISIYSEFSEFSRKQIKEYEKAFKKSLFCLFFFWNIPPSEKTQIFISISPKSAHHY